VNSIGVSLVALRRLLLHVLQDANAHGDIQPVGDAATIDPKTRLMPISAQGRLSISLDSLDRLAVLAGWPSLGDAFEELSVDVGLAPQQQADDSRQVHK
jgi:hypothetical protein